MLAGSDAHFLGELNLTEVTVTGEDLKNSILNGNIRITRQERSATSCRVATGLVRISKQKDPKILVGWARKLIPNH